MRAALPMTHRRIFAVDSGAQRRSRSRRKSSMADTARSQSCQEGFGVEARDDPPPLGDPRRGGLHLLEGLGASDIAIEEIGQSALAGGQASAQVGVEEGAENEVGSPICSRP